MKEIKEATRVDQLKEEILHLDSLISITNRVICNPKPKDSLLSLIRSERGLRRKHRESVIELHSLQNGIIDKGRGSTFGLSIAQQSINQYSN